MTNGNIPSDDDFARAKRLARARSQNIDAVNEVITQHLKKICPLHYFILMPQRENQFWAGVFFEKDEDILVSKGSGITEVIKNFVYAELERQGRGKREDISVVFEFDSNESVKRNFDGDYFLRLR